jgi:glycine cleavage system transcriptional repressor
MDKQHVLVTAVGPDRIGLVDRITEVLLRHGGNIEESRMARLAGDFAALILVSVPESSLQALDLNLNSLREEALEISIRQLKPIESAGLEGYLPFMVAVSGADHEGIIRSIAHVLHRLKVNIAELESEVVNAPTTGTPLFNMKAVLQVPPDLPIATLENALRQAGDDLGVLVELVPGVSEKPAVF